MRVQIPEECLHHISLFLPDALRAALTSYQEYVTTPGRGEGDKFKDYHVSCKAAVAHIQLLLKLAKMVDPGEDDSAAHPADKSGPVLLRATVGAAEAELAGYALRQQEKEKI